MLLRTMDASVVLSLLRKKHHADLFVSECKAGPTMGSSHFRLDAWVMPRSWAHRQCTGYEIKVARSDFLKDDKWPQYLDCCQLFYFVAPAGVIEKGEIPEPAGLLQVTKNGRSLRTIKKAPLREVDIPEELWRYVLMSRAKITPARMNEGQDKREYWEEWLREKVIDHEFGRQVAGKIGRRFYEEVGKVQAKQEILEIEMKPLREAQKLLKKMGISVGTWDNARKIEKRLLAALRAELPSGLRRSLNQAEMDLQQAIARLDEFEAESIAPKE